MQNEMTFKHYFDPGHGWVAVERKLIEGLGLLNQISPYSFQSKSGKTVYLEEDRDAALVVNALKTAGVNVLLESKETKSVRSYPRFKETV